MRYRIAAAPKRNMAGRNEVVRPRAPRRFLLLATSLFVPLLNIFPGAPCLRSQDMSDPVIASQGGNPRGMLIIYLMGDDGTPVTASGVVTIFRAGEVSGPHEDTGPNGVARFVQLANAAYTIVVSVPGYKDARSEADITPNHTVSELTVTMERLAGDPADEGNAKGMVLAPKAKKEAQEGIDAMRAGKYDEAEKHLRVAYKLAPGNPDVNDRMGELYLATRDYAKADSYLKQALSLDPDNTGALTDMGWLRVQQGDNTGAEAALERAITLEPQRWFTHWVLGVAYLREHKYEQSRAEAAIAIKVGKGAAVDAEYLLGESLAAAGRNEEAVKALQDFVHDAPNNANAKPAQALIANLRAAGRRPLMQGETGRGQDSSPGDTNPESH
jgi:Flp pilus assembly protein TadD